MVLPHNLEVSSQKEFLSGVQSVSETFLLHWILEYQVDQAPALPADSADTSGNDFSSAL